MGTNSSSATISVAGPIRAPADRGMALRCLPTLPAVTVASCAMPRPSVPCGANRPSLRGGSEGRCRSTLEALVPPLPQCNVVLAQVGVIEIDERLELGRGEANALLV